MKDLLLLLYGFIIGILILGLLSYCERPAMDNLINDRSSEIIVGTKYLYSNNWDEQNPFVKVEIDTVTVINIKKDYIQFRYNAGYVFSTKKIIFEMNAKNIK